MDTSCEALGADFKTLGFTPSKVITLGRAASWNLESGQLSEPVLGIPSMSTSLVQFHLGLRGKQTLVCVFPVSVL